MFLKKLLTLKFRFSYSPAAYHTMMSQIGRRSRAASLSNTPSRKPREKTPDPFSPFPEDYPEVEDNIYASEKDELSAITANMLMELDRADQMN